MDIRHRVDKTRVVKGVTFDPQSGAYATVINDVRLEYHVKYWEPDDVDKWEAVTVQTMKDGAALMDGSSHVAGVLNSNYRFVINQGVLTIEKLK